MVDQDLVRGLPLPDKGRDDLINLVETFYRKADTCAGGSQQLTVITIRKKRVVVM